jgi:(p)ppGpp synthase/HD superfamily hydrolase
VRLRGDDSVVAAARLSGRAHDGQVDKAGAPYVEHPRRVAATLAGSWAAETVAWLHDVVEDTGVTLADLRDQGFADEVCRAVDALTRRQAEAPDDYYARVTANPLALEVKRADLADNSDPARLAKLPPELRLRLEEKYDHARERLGPDEVPDRARDPRTRAPG